MSVTDQLNRPLKDLRISVIDRCNFRCPYCMPSEKFHHAYEFLDKKEWLSFDEITRLAKIFVKLGVRKIRLTGGEPLLRPDIDVLIKQLSTIEGVDDLALTTNGSFLAQWAPRLKAAGLKRLTVSIDSMDPQVFRQMSGDRGDLKAVLQGIDIAQHYGFKKIKINAVIQRGINDQGIIGLANFTRDTGNSVRFIEYMDVGNQNHWNIKQVVSAKEMIATIQSVYPLEYIGSTDDGETSERYRFKDGKGEIGFIASVTKAFCGTCQRLRLSADGKLYTCLFAVNGADIRDQLRLTQDNRAIEEIIRGVWEQRDDRYSEKRTELRKDEPSRSKVEMYHIGG